MACGEQGNNEGFCGLTLWLSGALVPVVIPSRSLEKKIKMSKLCYPRCIRTVDRARLK